MALPSRRSHFFLLMPLSHASSYAFMILYCSSALRFFLSFLYLLILSFSLFLWLIVPYSPLIHLCLSLFVSVSGSLCLSLVVYISLWLPLSVSPSLSVSVSLSFTCMYLSMSRVFPLSSFKTSFSAYSCLSLPLALSVSVCLSSYSNQRHVPFLSPIMPPSPSHSTSLLFSLFLPRCFIHPTNLRSFFYLLPKREWP